MGDPKYDLRKVLPEGEIRKEKIEDGYLYIGRTFGSNFGLVFRCKACGELVSLPKFKIANFLMGLYLSKFACSTCGHHQNYDIGRFKATLQEILTLDPDCKKVVVYIFDCR